MPLISVNHISLSYENLEVIRDLSFQVYRGDYLSIVGENGSGKSTLLKGLLGLKSLEQGKIKFHEPLKQQYIGYLPQQTVIQKDFPASVTEVVRSGLLNKKRWASFYNKEDKKTAWDKMEKLGIQHLAQKSYRNLSGGQQQRVLLARSLCAAKEVLVLDEPAGGLDPIVSNEMYELILRLNQEEHMTVIMVTHDMASALRYSKKILHLDPNQVFFGTVKEYRECPLCKKFIS